MNVIGRFSLRHDLGSISSIVVARPEEAAKGQEGRPRLGFDRVSRNFARVTKAGEFSGISQIRSVKRSLIIFVIFTKREIAIHNRIPDREKATPYRAVPTGDARSVPSIPLVSGGKMAAALILRSARVGVSVNAYGRPVAWHVCDTTECSHAGNERSAGGSGESATMASQSPIERHRG